MAIVIPIIADVKGLASGVGDTEKQLNRLGKNVGALGANLTKGLTLPIAGLAVGAVAAFDQVDSAIDDLAAKTGATGVELDGLEATFKSVASNATQGMGEVSSVVAELNRRLNLTGGPLDALSTKVLNFARVTGIDAEAAAIGVTKAMSAMGIEAADGAGFLDVLLKASQETGIGVEDLTENLVKFGPAMSQVGLDTNSTIALLAQFEQSGVNTQAAMGGLRKALVTLVKDGVKDIPGALEAGIESIQNAKTQAEATGIAIDLFGAKAGPDLAAAIRSGKLEIGDLIATLDQAQGTLDATATATEGPQEKLARLKNQVTLIGAAFADIFIPVLEKAFGPLQSITRAFQGLSEGQREAIVTTLAIVAAIGPLLMIVGKAIQIFAALRSIILAVQAAQIGLNLAMIANPIGLIVIAIAALIAALVIAYKRSETFREIVDEIGRVVRDNLVKAFEWLKVKIDEIWPSVKAFYEQAKPILKLIGEAVELYVSVYIQAVATYIRAWVTVLKTAYELIKPVAILIGGLIEDYIVAYVKAIKIAVDASVAAFNGLKSAVIGVRDFIAKPLETIEGMIRDSIGSAAEYAKGAIRGITGVFTTVVNGIREFWNKNVGGKGFAVPNWVPGFGGNSFKIPFLAEGGIVKSPTLAMIGEGGPEAVIPLNKMGQGGSTYNIVVNAGLGTNPDELSRVIVESIKRYEKRNGQVFSGPLAPTIATAAGKTSTASGATDFTRLVATRRG
jgi:TP901 family phage tail tape measure protein